MGFIIIILICTALTFFLRILQMGSESMLPTLQKEDRVIANTIIYQFREPQRGEIIIYRFFSGL